MKIVPILSIALISACVLLIQTVMIPRIWVAESNEPAGVLGYPLDAVSAAATGNTTIPLVSSCFNASMTRKSCGKPLPPFESPLKTCHSFRAFNGTGTKNLLQQVHFEQAMDEECWDMTSRTYKVDHKGAHNILDGCTVGIIFPRSLIAYCSCGVWNYNKNISFFFSGFQNAERKGSWLMSYANETDAQVNFTMTGRGIRKRTGLYDYPYYDNLMSSRFALAPDGDFPWTYRYLEGIMCGAIPIVSKREKPEEQELGYEYCEARQPCALLQDEEARRKAAQRNWLRFVRRHSFVTELNNPVQETNVQSGDSHPPSSLDLYPTLPLGCKDKSIFQPFLSQRTEELTRQALQESAIPTTTNCDLLIPISYAQQALRNEVSTLKTMFASMLREFLPRDTATISNDSNNALLQVIAACLSRSIPIIDNDKSLADLCLQLGIAFFSQNELCGSSTRTRHGIHVEQDTSNDCVRVAEPVFDQGLVDSNFNMVVKHYMLHQYAVSQLQNKPTRVSTSNKKLGIYVSGDGRISNGGDLFGPLVAQQILERRHQTSVNVVIGSLENKTATPAVIAVVGSTLQKGIRQANLITWGTGIIKNMTVSKRMSSSTILAVRGPRTRDLLLEQQGLNPMVISDPALIARDMNIPIPKTKELCFVIHAVDREYTKTKCPFCMSHLVNNYNRNPLIILESLGDCQRVVSSSLHGCIFSHALGIPALPIALGDRITGGDFKYIDYMHSVGVTSFQGRVNMAEIWEDKNLTESEWKHMVDTTVQPRFSVETKHFYETFPKVE